MCMDCSVLLDIFKLICDKNILISNIFLLSMIYLRYEFSLDTFYQTSYELMSSVDKLNTVTHKKGDLEYMFT
jgi:hypothetical protein